MDLDIWDCFQNTSRKLDPSYKMDLDIWNCFRMGKPIPKLNFGRLIYSDNWGQSGGQKPCLIAEYMW